MFIKINSSIKGIVYLNINSIEQFFFEKNQTKIFLVGSDEEYIPTQQTPEQIMKLIEEARKCL